MKTLFIDIETVELEDHGLSDFLEKREKTDMGGLFAETGKVICISAGYEERIKSYWGDNEPDILNEFKTDLSKFKGFTLCAHNGKGFDFPFLARRYIINGIKMPDVLNTMDKKPWETHLKDTMEMWRFGDFKHNVSLDVLCRILGIETPKNDITGADVGRLYREGEADGPKLGYNLGRIKNYCERDVAALMEVFKKIKQDEAEN